jgi:pimeloyl-ACP methyl ester carboxylesterase
MRLLNSLTLLSTLHAPLPVKAGLEQRHLQQQEQQPMQNVDVTHDERLTGQASPPPLQSTEPPGVSIPFFSSLERAARLVDISYCVGTTGISPPFSCVSRCKDFPSLHLERTWNTGVLMSDSCGYIAVDHGPQGATDDGKEIIVAFRGTYSITNTIVDLSTVPQEYVPYPGNGDRDDDPNDQPSDDPPPRCANCTVHTGFMSSWRAARDVVIPALRSARDRHRGYRVHLIGHSLGGAVAALAALELRLGLGWKDVRVTTFGEPRVGNAALARYIDAAFGLNATAPGTEDIQYRRVTHIGDPVPLLPLTEWGYRSHAGEVYIAKSDLPPGPGDLRLCRGDADPECMAGAETEDWLGRAMGWLRRGRKTWWLGGPRQEDEVVVENAGELGPRGFPARLKLWQLLFAHRDYFWRLGLCLPGGDPADWWREKYNFTEPMDVGLEVGDL